jgi:hypothetical protein
MTRLRFLGRRHRPPANDNFSDAHIDCYGYRSRWRAWCDGLVIVGILAGLLFVLFISPLLR